MRSKVVRLLPKSERLVFKPREYWGDIKFKGRKLEIPDMDSWLGEKEKLYSFECCVLKILSQSDRQLEREFRKFGKTKEERIEQVQYIAKWTSDWVEDFARHHDTGQLVVRRIGVISDRLWGREAVEDAIRQAREAKLERAREVRIRTGAGP